MTNSYNYKRSLFLSVSLLITHVMITNFWETEVYGSAPLCNSLVYFRLRPQEHIVIHLHE